MVFGKLLMPIGNVLTTQAATPSGVSFISMKWDPNYAKPYFLGLSHYSFDE